MLDSLIKVSEKIVSLLEYRQKRQTLNYGTYIAPLYGSLIDLHNEVIALLELILRAFHERAPILQIEASVETCRLKNEAQRRDLAAKLKAFRETIDDQLYDGFYRCAQTYLFNPRINRLARERKLAEASQIQLSSTRTILSAALQKTVRENRFVTASGLTQSETRLLTEYLGLVIQETRESWQRLAVAHAKVQSAIHQ